MFHNVPCPSMYSVLLHRFRGENFNKASFNHALKTFFERTRCLSDDLVHALLAPYAVKYSQSGKLKVFADEGSWAFFPCFSVT